MTCKAPVKSSLTKQHPMFYRPDSLLGDHAFPVAASHAWNSLPSSVRDIQVAPCIPPETEADPVQRLFCQLNLAFDGLLVMFRYFSFVRCPCNSLL